MLVPEAELEALLTAGAMGNEGWQNPADFNKELLSLVESGYLVRTYDKNKGETFKLTDKGRAAVESVKRNAPPTPKRFCSTNSGGYILD